jgi:phenylalanyl-tRNA synthetase beta chain
LPIKQPEVRVVESGPPAAEAAKVIIKDADLCPRYSARIIRKVKIGPSPAWMKQRLEQCGVRPINNVVDITNLVMLELGQPLHAFDGDLLKPLPGENLPAIVVRRSRPKEILVTLDGETRELDGEMLVIADGERAVALAGVMGGANSEVNDKTTTILLESAHFNPSSIRRTAKALALTSEASFRFERRVDPGGTVAALDRAAALLAEYAGGEIAPGVIDVAPQPWENPVCRVRAEKVNQLLGTELSPEQMAAYLRRLLMAVEIKGNILLVQAPSFRGDIMIEEDVAEEVARLHGYDQIPSQEISMGAAGGRLQPRLALEVEARRILLAAGLDETLNYSLEGPEENRKAGFPADSPLQTAVLVKNPKVEEYSQLRTSLLPSLLNLVARNQRRGQKELRAFELGRVYLPQAGEQLPEEKLRAGLALAGESSGWGKDKIDFYALKGIVEMLLARLRVTGVKYRPLEHPSFTPGTAAEAVIGDEQLAIMGEVNPAVLANYDLSETTYLAEIDLEKVLASQRDLPIFQPISRFPAMTRDIALLVAKNLPAEKVAATLREQAGELLESLQLFDVYEGKSLPKGYRSLAYALVFRAPERTLTEEEITTIMGNIETALGDMGVNLRR